MIRPREITDEALKKPLTQEERDELLDVLDWRRSPGPMNLRYLIREVLLLRDEVEALKACAPATNQAQSVSQG